MKKVAFLILAFAVSLLAVNVVFAANPPGTGQPNQNCEALPPQYEPHGFTTNGFANAAEHYAGSGVNVDHANSPNAVSQYDVACYQQYMNGNVHVR